MIFLAVLLAAGCGPLDDARSAHALASRWAFVDKVLVVSSRSGCTAAEFSLVSEALRRTGGPVAVTDVRAALPLLDAGRAVAFEIPGASPNTVSEQLMSVHLFEGLGLLSSFLQPARDCMDDAMATAAYRALMSPRTTMVFDPRSYVMLLVQRDRARAILLRIKV